MTVAQILAVSIFVVMFVLMVLDKIEKQYITLVAAVLIHGAVSLAECISL
mgnify:CR=1 FL=1